MSALAVKMIAAARLKKIALLKLNRKLRAKKNYCVYSLNKMNKTSWTIRKRLMLSFKRIMIKRTCKPNERLMQKLVISKQPMRRPSATKPNKISWKINVNSNYALIKKKPMLIRNVRKTKKRSKNLWLSWTSNPFTSQIPRKWPLLKRWSPKKTITSALARINNLPNRKPQIPSFRKPRNPLVWLKVLLTAKPQPKSRLKTLLLFLNNLLNQRSNLRSNLRRLWSRKNPRSKKRSLFQLFLPRNLSR